jgi:predicted GNAT family N-acyltransferase
MNWSPPVSSIDEDVRQGEEPEPLDTRLHVREVWGPGELELIFQIRDEVFVHEQHLTDDARHDPDDAESIHFLAFSGAEPVGTGRLTMYGREAQIAWVATRSSHRGTGIGKAIMRAMIDRARREGAEYVMLNAQTHAIGFYEELGFRTVGTEFFMSSIGHQVMVLRF